jgi:hypothetical protein
MNVRELMRRPRPIDTLAVAIFALAVLYTFVQGTQHTILAGVAIVLIVFGALPKQLALAVLLGALVIFLLQSYRSVEGFASGATDPSGNALSGTAAGETEPEPREGSPKAQEGSPKAEEVASTAVSKEGFAATKKPMLPDNATRREPLELGKPYKLPSEADDKGFHLDAGTTFLNAYKALKPDQISAMTRDTQELLATQQSLVAMLDSFAPLLKDMNKITGFFGGK